MTDVVVLQRLLLITVLAGIIGFERERHGRAAGFRTHILVGVGSCLVMLTGLYLTDVYLSRAPFDPTRMAAQVLSGIGFLGAGTILRSRTSVRGLTTAASLWAVTGVGLAIGAGLNLYAAVLVTGLGIRYGWLTNMPGELGLLAHPVVLIAAGVMYLLAVPR